LLRVKRRVVFSLYVGVVVPTAPQDGLRLRLLFGFKLFSNVWRGVAATISCTRQHRAYVEVGAVWCGAMY